MADEAEGRYYRANTAGRIRAGNLEPAMRLVSCLLLSVTGLSLLACAGVKLVHKPSVESLSVSVDSVAGGERVQFSAVVTDPDGVADILTGTLKDSASGALYGTFVKDGSTWSVILSWEDVSTVAPFEFDEEEVRTFEAVFLDEAGHESKAVTVDVTFTCNGDATCDGVCPNLESDEENCGACGTTCDDYELFSADGPVARSAQCAEGRCVVASDCTDEIEDTCDELCAAQGFSGCPTIAGDIGLIFDADPNRCAGDPITYDRINTCDEDQSGRDDLSFMSCLCLE